jgi:hypothetical protein
LYLTFSKCNFRFSSQFFYYFSDLHLFYKGRLSSSECRESQTRSSRLEEERTFERQKGHVRVLKLKKCQQQQVNIIYRLVLSSICSSNLKVKCKIIGHTNCKKNAALIPLRNLTITKWILQKQFFFKLFVVLRRILQKFSQVKEPSIGKQKGLKLLNYFFHALHRSYIQRLISKEWFWIL